MSMISSDSVESCEEKSTDVSDSDFGMTALLKRVPQEDLSEEERPT